MDKCLSVFIGRTCNSSCPTSQPSACMPSLILKNHLSLKDKNGLAVGAWAKPSLPGYALCSWCNNSTICFKTGTLKLTKHSETEKHINNKPKDLVNTTLQLTLEEAISDAAAEKNKELELKNKVREWRLTWCVHFHATEYRSR